MAATEITFPPLADFGKMEESYRTLVRVSTTKARIAYAANFAALNSVAPEKFRQKPCCGSMHRIKRKAEVGLADTVPIN